MNAPDRDDCYTKKQLEEGIAEAAKMFLPDREHWGEPPIQIAQWLRIPIRRAPVKPGLAEDGKPFFEVLSCSWEVPVGPFTKEEFDELLHGATSDLVSYIHGTFEVFRPYPITHVPEVKYGVAFHDWRGLEYPFDVRAVMALEAGFVKFHLSTLVARDA